MALQSPIAAPSGPQPQRQAQVFEFTKRKKWADILVSELPDTVLLILDTDGYIQYVGANANDVLGWEVEDLSETDVLDIVNDDDKKTFGDHFQKSLGSQQDLSCYARLKCKPTSITGSEQGASHKELLFEIRGHALYLPDDNECKCFFFTAKPYPSRNMAILNTFLELKIENERLTQRLRDLKARQDVMPGSISALPVPMPPSAMSHPQFANFDFSGPRDGALQSPSASTVGSFNTGFIHSAVPSTNTRDEEDEEGGKKKKKLKKTHAPAAQYVCVTCGRTDSPEWRKGPRGPKTLCNACGLRWAKRSKRTDDVPIPYVQGQGSQEGPDAARPLPSTPGGSTRGGRGGAPVANAALSVTPTEPPSASSSSQQQSQQGRYNTQVPTPSPTHTSLSQTSMASLPPPLPPAPPSGGHYVVHPHVPAPPPMHHQNIQPSPTSAHGFVQAQAQEQYQAAYDHYPWPMNQHREGGYGY